MKPYDISKNFVCKTFFLSSVSIFSMYDNVYLSEFLIKSFLTSSYREGFNHGCECKLMTQGHRNGERNSESENKEINDPQTKIFPL